MSLQPLGTLRLRLTAWYIATFCAILLLLGGGLFVVIRHQLSAQLDDSLRDSTAELERAAQIREMEARSARGAVVDAVDELHIPDRALYLFDAQGRPVKPPTAPPWIEASARAALREGRVETDRDQGGDRTLRLHAERFTLQSGTRLVAVATADKVELEDRYAALIFAFGGAAMVALVLVAGGGWLLVRKSTAPVERTIEYMRRFMADAAHELRTPLTVLRTRAEVALQQPREAPAYAAALRGIEAESQRLGRIVEDLLMLARADTGERPIERRRVYLDDIAMDAVGAARAMAETKQVELRIDEFEEAMVEGDAGLLRQLVMILLDNAVKFTPSGGRVTVAVSAPAGRTTLVVSDTGIGIAPDQLPHVFERFWRVDPARSRGGARPELDSARRDGAGLGLSIARWVADAHGAEIVVQSAQGDGSGTHVSVRFPPLPAVVGRGG
ncbi:MAG TPA: ATP-binding protein [Gemmatimonadaceae bacterium]|nr:ATP-binding protein [Gemmatimonadaceae bacterium]